MRHSGLLHQLNIVAAEIIVVSGIILYIRNKSTGSLKWIRYSNKLTIVRSLPNQGNHHQWRTALHSYSQQMISLFPSSFLQLCYTAGFCCPQYREVKVGRQEQSYEAALISLPQRSIYRAARGRNDLIRGKQNTIPCLWR